MGSKRFEGVQEDHWLPSSSKHEHCLRSWSFGDVGAVHNISLQYLQSSCGCRSGIVGCLGCLAVAPSLPPPPEPAFALSTPSPPPPDAPLPRVRVAQHRKRKRDVALGRAGVPLPRKTATHKLADRKLATPSSLAAPTAAAERALVCVVEWPVHPASRAYREAPRVSVVLHALESVKHALPSCATRPGQANHHTPDMERKAQAQAASKPLLLHVPPAQYDAKPFAAAQSQLKLLEHARVASGGRIAYTLVYEAMQRDLTGEIHRLLRALGVPLPSRRTRAPRDGAHQGGAEEMRGTLHNYDELHATFAKWPCLLRMLTAPPTGPSLRQCAREIDAWNTRPWTRLSEPPASAIGSGRRSTRPSASATRERAATQESDSDATARHQQRRDSTLRHTWNNGPRSVHVCV